MPLPPGRVVSDKVWLRKVWLRISHYRQSPLDVDVQISHCIQLTYVKKRQISHYRLFPLDVELQTSCELQLTQIKLQCCFPVSSRISQLIRATCY